MQHRFACLIYRALQRMAASEGAFLDRFGINGLPRVRALVEAADAKAKDIGDVIDEVEYGELDARREFHRNRVLQPICL
jgi:hypothetical protein